jgi:hypothetical protein
MGQRSGRGGRGVGSANAVAGGVSGTVVQAGTIGDLHVHSLAPFEMPKRHRAGVVPQRPGCFQDRAVSLVLAGSMRCDTAAALTGTEPVRTVVLSGLGGVGKTQLAADYAEQRWRDEKVDVLAWINAGSKESIIDGYVDLAVALLDQDDVNTPRSVARLLAWLAEPTRRWLIVLDDVQSPADVSGLWPPHTAKGQVVVTTRRRDAALHGHQRRLIPVGLFEPAEAHAYLRAKLAGTGLDGATDEASAELADDLGHLPVALAQAAAYMIDRGLSCAEYRTRLADRRRRLASLLPDADGLPDEHRSTVAATWSLSVDRANQLEPVGLARPLLHLASLLDHDGIPTAVFTADAVLAHLTDVVGRPASADDARDALRCLHRLNLITHDPHVPHRSVSMHALVQRATRDHTAEQPLQPDLAGAAADALLQVWRDVGSEPTMHRVLRANTEVLHQGHEEDLWKTDGHPLLFRAGYSLGESGLFQTAAVYFQQLHATACQRLGSDHPTTLLALHDLAHWRGLARDAAGTANALEDLKASQVPMLGSSHPETLLTRGELARWRGEAGDAAGAVAALEELLAEHLRVFSASHPETLLTRANLADWRGEAGDVAGAVAALEELMADQARTLGPNHPYTLLARDHFACWREVEATR